MRINYEHLLIVSIFIKRHVGSISIEPSTAEKIVLTDKESRTRMVTGLICEALNE